MDVPGNQSVQCSICKEQVFHWHIGRTTDGHNICTPCHRITSSALHQGLVSLKDALDVQRKQREYDKSLNAFLLRVRKRCTALNLKVEKELLQWEEVEVMIAEVQYRKDRSLLELDEHHAILKHLSSLPEFTAHDKVSVDRSRGGYDLMLLRAGYLERLKVVRRPSTSLMRAFARTDSAGSTEEELFSELG